VITHDAEKIIKIIGKRKKEKEKGKGKRRNS
jgi:hypothetical protein